MKMLRNSAKVYPLLGTPTNKVVCRLKNFNCAVVLYALLCIIVMGTCNVATSFMRVLGECTLRCVNGMPPGYKAA